MSDQIIPAQDTSIELSEQDLEAVAGGAAGVNVGIGAAAQGTLSALTNSSVITNAISEGPISIAIGTGIGVAVGINKPSFPQA